MAVVVGSWTRISGVGMSLFRSFEGLVSSFFMPTGAVEEAFDRSVEILPGGTGLCERRRLSFKAFDQATPSISLPFRLGNLNGESGDGAGSSIDVTE